MSGAGRNDPCPCGSGKKYKKCCQDNGTGYTKADRGAALGALAELVHGPGWGRIMEAAQDEFWDELEPEHTAVAEQEYAAVTSAQVFEWWLFFDYEYEPGRYIVDALLELAQGLPRGARSFLKLARATMMRVYQVIDVQPGVGMTLRDVITGRETRVGERLASQQLHRWDVIATRIMPAGVPGNPVLDGGLLPIPMMRAESLIEWLQGVVEEEATEPAGHSASEKEIFADVAPDIHRAWIAPMEMPKLVNYDGDPVVLAHAYFDIVDREGTVAALGAARDLERVDEAQSAPRWAWSGTGKDRKEPVVYGWFTIEGERLVFETNSVKRAERGRKLVERLAGAAATYRLTRTEDLHQAMDAMRQRGAPEAHGLPSELREAGNAAVEQHLTLHYERWLDEKIPRLDDATPREAATSPELRSRVVEMLKELEIMYEKALSSGEGAFDPTWMWEELGLGQERDAPDLRKQAPVLGHEALYRHFPELGPLARDLAERIRKQARASELSRVVSEEDLAGDLAYQRFARACPSPEFAHHAATALSNFELHLRKVFWVGESLSWMLGATKLDVTGDAVRLPFRSLGFVFTDRYALGLAERVDARLPPEHRTGRMLQVLTVYVTQTWGGDDGAGRRLVDLTLIGDVLDGTRPTVVPCRLELRDGARLDEILGAVTPGVAGLDEDEGVRPLYESTPLRDLLSLVANALLYATSADAEAREVQPGSSTKKNERGLPIFTSETVFHLPGTIDIKTLEQVRKARRGGREHDLTRRCMVRGHWRRAQEGWEDQRPRWIRPHWRGPSAAAIVERQYRLDE
jgi:hypothetical protein